MTAENYYSQEKEVGSIWWVVLQETFEDGVLVGTKQMQTPMTKFLADFVAASMNDIAFQLGTHIFRFSDEFGDWKPEHGNKKSAQSVRASQERIA